MSSKQTLALALCFAITGCAQTPKNDADGGSWWPFGSSDKVAAKEPAPAPAPLKPAATAPVAKAESSSPWYWPFGSDDSAAAKPEVKAEAKPEAKPVEVAKAEADKGGKWWWPFGGKEQDTAKVVPMPDPKVTQAWLDDYEPRLRTAIKDSNLQLERRENVLVVTAPVEGSFNPDRPAMLLPVTLGPFTRVAKILEADPKTAVLVLGHSDTTGAAPANVKLSQERAQAVAAIFRLSGLQRDRLMLRGMGSEAPRAANDSVEGRALNRRVELLVTPQNTMVALLSKYNMPAPKPVTMVAAQDVKPAAKPVTPAPAAKKAAVPATKKAPAKKAAAKAPAKKAPAKKTAPAKAAATDKKVAATDTTKK
ncbi:OmpA family protein [Pseudomonas fluorescens]|uniref:Putative outer membrane protein n=1 Tax=Pseudomonas fluorescens (strain Pf0-1) TaxID=205922 RepID=Q3KGY5_PSEPF|nr:MULTISPECIES: OmpA family protein [Pseudomonas]ABA72971.1 putative outer membrane protein [Pseudomonas fluorescens Pf0-1]MBX8622511.1 OmpA family protein [Pseudomonas glycinae]MBY9022822.1 OmpA family protein [Pseudomonas fluorescens]MBY9028814.1 OmpA family protein [Pseudomonas fluorescens]MBY9034968.1 OmpA family protein [Pseudomonas fluorescens]